MRASRPRPQLRAKGAIEHPLNTFPEKRDSAQVREGELWELTPLLHRAHQNVALAPRRQLDHPVGRHVGQRHRLVLRRERRVVDPPAAAADFFSS